MYGQYFLLTAVSEAEARIYSSVGAVQRDSHEHIDETGDDDEGSDADGENTEDSEPRSRGPGGSSSRDDAAVVVQVSTAG